MRLRDYANLGIDATNGYEKSASYARIYDYGELNTFEKAMKEPETEYDHSITSGFFHFLFMRPWRTQFPITIDKFTCAFVLTFTVILFLVATFSFASGPNFMVGAGQEGEQPDFHKFYTWYAIVLWVVPFYALAVAVVLFFIDARRSRKEPDKRPRNRLALKIMLLVAGALAIAIGYSTIGDVLIYTSSISQYWLRTWIFVCGALLFIPTYLVTFASLIYPGIERQIEHDLAVLFPGE